MPPPRRHTTESVYSYTPPEKLLVRGLHRRDVTVPAPGMTRSGLAGRHSADAVPAFRDVVPVLTTRSRSGRQALGSGQRLRAVPTREEDRAIGSGDIHLHDVDLVGEAFEEKRVADRQSRGAARSNRPSDPGNVGSALRGAPRDGQGCSRPV